jgi:hypothetical protein
MDGVHPVDVEEQARERERRDDPPAGEEGQRTEAHHLRRRAVRQVVLADDVHCEGENINRRHRRCDKRGLRVLEQRARELVREPHREQPKEDEQREENHGERDVAREEPDRREENGGVGARHRLEKRVVFERRLAGELADQRELESVVDRADQVALRDYAGDGDHSQQPERRPGRDHSGPGVGRVRHSPVHS